MIRVLKAFDTGFDKLILGTGALGMVLALLLSVMVFGLTLFRYVFHYNIPGLFDGSMYLLIVFPFLTVAYTMRQNKHIVIDFLTSRLPEKTRSIMSIAVYCVASTFVVGLGWQAWRWAMVSFKYKALTPGAWPVHKGALSLFFVFGCLLLLIQIIRYVVSTIRSIPKQKGATRLADSPWLWVSSFILLVAISAALLTYGSAGAGLTLLAVVILLSGGPVYLALGLIGFLGLYFFIGPNSLLQMPIQVYTALNSFPLTCLPLFILGGLIMEKCGIADDLFKSFEVWVGRSRISPLMVTVTLGMVFNAVSGSSVGTTAVIGTVTLPILFRKGFNKAIACGAAAAVGVGSLIPPSIGYVVYAVLTDESVGALFIATMIPALMLYGLYYVFFFALDKINPKLLFENGQVPKEFTDVRVTSWKERAASLKLAFWGLLAPVLILGGIYFGVYTPTEAAAVLVVYAILVAIFVKKLKWKFIANATLDSAVTASMILCIIVGAFIFSLVISQTKASDAIVAWAESMGLGQTGVIVIIFIVLVILGMFVDASSMKVITVPIFFPLAMAVGINNLWLGVFYQFLIEIGLLTPPVGLNAFVIKGVAGDQVSLRTVFIGSMPFVLMMVLVVVLIYFFPELVTWLPGTMRKPT